MPNRREQLKQIARTNGVAILYAFGSRAEEVRDWLDRAGGRLPRGPSDVDVGIRPAPGALRSVKDKVRLAQALEDFLGCDRVDLVVLPEADPFVAAEVIRGERLFAADPHAADEYDLYILRRAGDLAPLERERLQLILEKDR